MFLVSSGSGHETSSPSLDMNVSSHCVTLTCDSLPVSDICQSDDHNERLSVTTDCLQPTTTTTTTTTTTRPAVAAAVDDDMFYDADTCTAMLQSTHTSNGQVHTSTNQPASQTSSSSCLLVVCCAVALSIIFIVCGLLVMTLFVLESNTDQALVASIRRLPEVCHFYNDVYMPWRHWLIGGHYYHANCHTLGESIVQMDESTSDMCMVT